MSATPNPATWRPGSVLPVLHGRPQLLQAHIERPCDGPNIRPGRVAESSFDAGQRGDGHVRLEREVFLSHTVSKTEAMQDGREPAVRLAHSDTPNAEFIGAPGGARGEHKVPKAVQQSGLDEPAHGVFGREAVVDLAGDLIDRPGVLRNTKEEVQNAVVPQLLAQTVLALLVVNTMVRHRKVQPFGVAAPGQFTLSPGPTF